MAFEVGGRVMQCPIMNRQPSYEGGCDVNNECIQSQCAWWDTCNKQCGIVTIGWGISRIVVDGLSIVHTQPKPKR